MKTNWKMIGIAAGSAALLFYPAMKLYQYLMSNASNKKGVDADHQHIVKAFVPAYKGKQAAHPHHRSSNGHNGHAGRGSA